jgi:tetratricopeptide (TPR) repeat protein
MGTAKTTPGWALLALAFLLGLGLFTTAVARDNDDEKLKEKAKALNKITGDEPEANKVQELIKDPAGTKKLLAVASAMAKDKKDTFNINATMILAKAAYGVRDYEIAEQFYRQNIEQATKVSSSRRIAESYAGLISLLYNSKKFAETEKACLAYLEQEPDETITRLRPIVERQMILAVAKQGDLDRAFKMVDTRLKDAKKKWLVLQFKARLQREVGKYDDSIKTYDEVSETVKKDDDLTKGEQEEILDDVQYALTGVYVEKKEIKKAADILQKLLEKDADNPTYNNDLGFIWADHDMNLEESEKLIRKAIDEDRKQRKKKANVTPEEDKDNAAYLDSLGWVLFKLKKYKEAKPYLEDALKDEEGQHVEIYDHLAEVQLALGDKKGAIETWKKGIAAAGPTLREEERKNEIEKKLKDIEK